MKLTNDMRILPPAFARNHEDEWPADGLSPQSNSNAIEVTGNTVSWPNDCAWYEAQSSSTHETVAEGFHGATLPPGVYNIINHHTGERHEGIRVGGGNDAPSWSALASSPTTMESLLQRQSGDSVFPPVQERRLLQPSTSTNDNPNVSTGFRLQRYMG